MLKGLRSLTSDWPSMKFIPVHNQRGELPMALPSLPFLEEKNNAN
jgi:hypothetical protein